MDLTSIHWSKRYGSPFDRQTARPIRILVDTKGADELEASQLASQNLLLELGHLDHIEMYLTNPGEHPHVQYLSSIGGCLPIQTGVKRWRGIAGYGDLLERSESEANPEAWLANEILVHTCPALNIDILVANQVGELGTSGAKGVNVLRPRAALLLVGLLLRSRDVFDLGRYHGSDGYSFYHYLAATHIRVYPDLALEPKRLRDGVAERSQSIHVRVARVLRAADLIASARLAERPSGQIETVTYHLDYLLLIVSGVFDALAEILHIAGQHELPGKEAAFGREKFTDDLSRSLPQVHDHVSSPGFMSPLKVIRTLRNRIHTSYYPELVHWTTTSKTQRLIITQEDEEVIRSQASLGFDLEAWGFQDGERMTVDPVLFAFSTVRYALNELNRVLEILSNGLSVPDEFPETEWYSNVRLLGGLWG